MGGKLVKDREDEASQLNRLGETGQAPSLLQSFRRRAVVSNIASQSYRFLRLTNNVANSSSGSNLELATEN